MKRLLFAPMIWGLAGLGAVLGSILLARFGQRWLFTGAVLGGIVATIASARLAVALGFVSRGQFRGASIGGVIGFAVAAPIAASNLHTPVIPILATGLVALGAMLGASALRARDPVRPPG